MHYCFFTSGSLEANGTLMRVRDLGAAMADLGVQVSYLVDDYPFNRDALKLHPKARKHIVPGGHPLTRAWHRRRVIREVKADFVHILSPNISAFLSLFGVCGNLVGDWDEWPARRKYLPWRLRVLIGLIDKWLRRRASKIVVASRYMQRAFESEFGCDVLYLPHASFFADYPDGVSPFSQPTAVYMGNFYPAYDHDILFHAALILKQRGLMPQMEIIGAGPELEKWKQWVNEKALTNISLPGYLMNEELWRHLRHAHVLLFPLRTSDVNLYRCPGKTFMYAHARRPTIASKVGEVPEVLGDHGTYVDATPEAFADAIALAMKTPLLPDVDYPLSSWDVRARTLLESLGRSNQPQSKIQGAVA